MHRRILVASTASALGVIGLSGGVQAAPIVPLSYTYIVPPQGGNPYPDSGNELTDGIIPTRSWGTRTIRNFSQAADWSGWQFVNPTVRFDFGRTVDIGSVRLTADDGNGAAGVRFPLGATFEAGGQTVTRAISDPSGAGPAQELFSGLNLVGDSLTLTVDGGNRNWTMLGEVEFDSTDFIFDGYEHDAVNSISGRIESPFGTVLSTLSEIRINDEQTVTDAADGRRYDVVTTGELFVPASSSNVLNEVSQAIADASIQAAVLAVNDFGNDGTAIDQIDAALGNNRVELRTTDGAFGTLKSYADATVGWSDYFVIEGDDGTGELTLNFDVEGAISGDDSGISFSVAATDLSGGSLANNGAYIASSSTHGSRGYFVDPYSVSIPFTYNEVFQLSAVLDAFSNGNSSVEFLNTVKIDQFIIPDGANLRSSAEESGATDGGNYNVVSRSQATGVPVPNGAMLLGLGLWLMAGRYWLSIRRSNHWRRHIFTV